jgi:hypothetical protein
MAFFFDIKYSIQYDSISYVRECGMETDVQCGHDGR